MPRLYKKQKLCSTVAIDKLFAPASGAARTLAYPLRAIWRNNPGRRCDAPLQMLISVPKKRLRHAVDRVLMRRRIREAFRLNFESCRLTDDARIDLAFIYVANTPEPYPAVAQAMRRILDKIQNSGNATQGASQTLTASPTDNCTSECSAKP